MDELRRVARVSVCCGVVVRDRYGTWTAVTEDLCVHGCRIHTKRLLRPGSPLVVTLSSDHFPEELDEIAEAAWTTQDVLGISFVRTVRRNGGLSRKEWLEKLVEHGTVAGSSGASRLVPVVTRPPSRTPPPVPIGEPRLQLAKGDLGLERAR